MIAFATRPFNLLYTGSRTFQHPIRLRIGSGRCRNLTHSIILTASGRSTGIDETRRSIQESDDDYSLALCIERLTTRKPTPTQPMSLIYSLISLFLNPILHSLPRGSGRDIVPPSTSTRQRSQTPYMYMYVLLTSGDSGASLNLRVSERRRSRNSLAS